MAVCRKCGSIRTALVSGGLFQRLLAFVLRQRVLLCRRCGWQGRARVAPSSTGDDAPRRRRHTRDTHGVVREPVQDLDLDALDRGLGSEPPKGLTF